MMAEKIKQCGCESIWYKKMSFTMMLALLINFIPSIIWFLMFGVTLVLTIIYTHKEYVEKSES
jgi:hypothetical protein